MFVAIDIIIAIAFTAACSVFVRKLSGGTLPKWWLWIAIVPFLSWGVALAVILMPRPFASDFNTGRADFVALIFYGLVLPMAYLAIAVPIVFVTKSMKTRSKKK